VSLRKWIKEFREDWAAAGEALDRNERARARRRAAALRAPQDDAQRPPGAWLPPPARRLPRPLPARRTRAARGLD
jgi:hypothetical protein